MEKYEPIPQVTPAEDRETTITIEHSHNTIVIWSNNATILNRLGEEGFIHYAEQTKKGKVLARQFRLPISQLSKVLKVKLYKLY